MDSGIRIGRILGIPIYLHPTWFLVFLLVALQLWSQFAAEYPSLSPAWRLGIAGVTSGLVFGSILMHELGHSIVALRHGVAVRSITLFIFGGLAFMEREPDDARAELQIALAGPAVNVFLFALFFGLSGLFAPGSPGMAVFGWLALLNLGVALFNLLPGFPLDGGRVLRAILWARRRRPAQATRLAARIGQIIAYGLVGFGAVVAAFGALVSGVWLAFIGWFILVASVAHRRQATFEISLHGMVARDVMTPRVPTVEAGLNVARFTRELLRGDRWALVMRDGVPCGLVSRTDVKRLPPESWESTRVEEIATPMERVVLATPDLPVAEVLRLLRERRANQIPIVDGDGRVLGAVTLQDLLQAIQVRPPDLQPRRGTPVPQDRVL